MTDSIHTIFKKLICVKPSCYPCVPAWLELVPCNLWKAPCYSAIPLAGTGSSHICKWKKQTKKMHKTSLGTGLKRESWLVIYFHIFLMGWRLQAGLLTPMGLNINKFTLTKSAWDVLYPKLILHLSFFLSISFSRGRNLACRWCINQKLLWQYRHKQHCKKVFHTGKVPVQCKRQQKIYWNFKTKIGNIIFQRRSAARSQQKGHSKS